MTMAYSTLLSLEKIIDQNLDHDQFYISPCEKREMICLDKCVISFQAFLEDFPEKGKKLEGRIRDVAAEAEDIIECFLEEQICCSCIYTEWIAKLRGITFHKQLQKVRDKMDLIAAEVVEIKNSSEVKDVQLGDTVGDSSSSQVAEKINAVGFNEDLVEIKDRLCGSAPRLQILPIFGMGGIGKTTLARNVYDDQLIMEHFHVRVWITISQDYSERRILLGLLDSMKEFDPDWKRESMKENSKQYGETAGRFESPEEKSEQCNESQTKISKQSDGFLAKIHVLSNSEIALKVHKILSVRRFLIVMDDIWSTKVLDCVKHFFPDSKNGSRIMLTTRLTEVAIYANSSTISHEMRLLDADQSWNLLRHKVFVHQDLVHHELESTGREIARSCGGLPLAIVVISGFLSSKTLTSWEEVAKNIRSSLATTDGLIEKILSLSYNDLPQHLRPCFLYMGGFPEDHEIKVTNLMRLWIAESFVKPIASQDIEDTAEEYLKDLVDRSLIIVTKRKSNGKIKCCSLHDLVREMCIKLSQEDKFLVLIKGSKEPKRVKDLRRISISQCDLNSSSNFYCSTIRTIMYFEDTFNSFLRFRFLRVLNMLRAQPQSGNLFDQFYLLFHLRYLALCYSQPIPTSISKLQYLQTLIIKDISECEYLPYTIWKMQELRHLMISNCHLGFSQYAMVPLENLHTLGKLEDLTCYWSTLELIPNLKKLWLTYSSKHREFLFHNFVHLSRLEKLHLELQGTRKILDKPNLVLPSSLKKLTLVGWGRRGLGLDIVGPFPNLEVLKLKRFGFNQQVWKTNDEEFHQLKFLLIEGSDITQWETESSHFPRLKTLHICSCLDLSEIPECIGEIPTLELIELKLCSDSLVDSAKRIQEEAQSYGDDAFQVRCIIYKPNEVIPPKPIVRLPKVVKKVRRQRGTRLIHYARTLN